MILSNLNLSNLIISIDPNTPIAVALMNDHLGSVDPHPQYATKTLVNNLIDINVENAVDYLVSLLVAHQNALNPHPQYLLATTFGVHLLMDAQSIHLFKIKIEYMAGMVRMGILILQVVQSLVDIF
jgi:hypothetical protein